MYFYHFTYIFFLFSENWYPEYDDVPFQLIYSGSKYILRGFMIFFLLSVCVLEGGLFFRTRGKRYVIVCGLWCYILLLLKTMFGGLSGLANFCQKTIVIFIWFVVIYDWYLLYKIHVIYNIYIYAGNTSYSYCFILFYAHLIIDWLIVA